MLGEKEVKCGYCGQPVKTWIQHHTFKDCQNYLKERMEQSPNPTGQSLPQVDGEAELLRLPKVSGGGEKRGVN